MQTGKLYILTVSLAAILMLGGCDKAEIIENQRTTILTWIESKGVVYEEVSKGVFRNIVNPDDGQGTPVAVQGDYVSLTVKIYSFSSGFTGAGDERDLIYTNQKDLIPIGVIWSTDPVETILGHGLIMPGVEKSLIGAAPGDTVTVLMTSENAYGNNQIQQLPADSPIAWIVKVNKVEK